MLRIRNSWYVIFVWLCVIVILSGCDLDIPKASDTFFAMDTVMTVELQGKDSQKAIDEIRQMIFDLDKRLNPNNEDSEVAVLNQHKSIDASDDLLNLTKISLEYSKLTNGSLDISTYSAVTKWGFGTEHPKVPSSDELKKLVPCIDYRKIKIQGNKISIPENMTVNYGAVAKGYATDKALKIAKDYNIRAGYINLGGNVACFGDLIGQDSFNIGIEDPKNAGSVIGVLKTKDKSIVSSGNYQRYFVENNVRYHHIIDPKTASPVVTDVNMITVICDSSVEADCMSTALYVMGEDAAINYWKNNLEKFNFIIVKDNVIICSGGLREKFENRSNLRLEWID